MNCECIMVFKPDPNNPAEPETLAELLHFYVSDNIELYPVAVSKITRETRCYASYDAAHGWAPKNNKTTLHNGDYVLFVGGKLHHMNKTTIKRYFPASDKQYLSHFAIIHPDTDEDFFEDIKTF